MAADLPELFTCSYAAYRRPMGAIVRITLGTPRGVKLPDARYGEFTHWPSITELAPARSYFHAPAAEFDQLYLDQLDRQAEAIGAKLRTVYPGAGRLVLACFERRIAGPECHRRLAARWLQERYNVQVPELDPAPGGCK